VNRILVWLRRDLRTEDHAALSAACTHARSVCCAFVFDRDILDALPERADRRVEFIHDSVAEVDAALRRAGGGLAVAHGRAPEEIPRLARALGADAVYANRDYEPQAVARDEAVARALERDGRRLMLFKDQVVFERDEVVTAAGRAFSVFTPYRNAWLRALDDAAVAARAVDLTGRLAPPPPPEFALPSIEALGFERTGLRALGVTPGMAGAAGLVRSFSERIGRYHEARDFPAVKGVSYLSAHLRFGTVSVRSLVRLARDVIGADAGAAAGARGWLSELVWRDFYFQILHHHPHVVERAFKPEYDRIRWVGGDEGARRLDAWCAGRTGYPLVDAAIAQILASGWMHNRLRMVVASFLVKDLGVDWRAGERWFARHLIDFDLAANNGGWQWAASSGCDAQPWFRIFNPVTQSERFDPRGQFIRRYLPQLARLPDAAIHAPWRAGADRLAAAGIALGRDYPPPIVDHDEARRLTLARYEVVKAGRPAA